MVSAAVQHTAKILKVLHSFVWDGEELLPYDVICASYIMHWCGPFVVDALIELKAFSLSCPHPQLKFISTSLSSILSPPNSHVCALHKYSSSIFVLANIFACLCVTFEWNVLLDLSREAATKTFSSLKMELLLQVLGQRTRAMTVWMIRGDEGMGDIPGIQGVQGVCRFCAT